MKARRKKITNVDVSSKTMGNELELPLKNQLFPMQNSIQKLPDGHRNLNSSTEMRIILHRWHINFGWLAHRLIEVLLIR